MNDVSSVVITDDLIDHVISCIAAKGLSEASVRDLRSQYEGAHFTYCMDDDVAVEKAYRECDGFNIYLVNSSDHCSVLTNDATSASGLVLAEVIDDE